MYASRRQDSSLGHHPHSQQHPRILFCSHNLSLDPGAANWLAPEHQRLEHGNLIDLPRTGVSGRLIAFLKREYTRVTVGIPNLGLIGIRLCSLC